MAEVPKIKSSYSHSQYLNLPSSPPPPPPNTHTHTPFEN